MEEGSAIRNKDHLYHLDNVGLGRVNGYSRRTYPGDVDLMYLGKHHDRWLFGEVKMEGGIFRPEQRYFQETLAKDIYKKRVVFAFMTFDPKYLKLDKTVETRNCIARYLFVKPEMQDEGFWCEIVDPFVRRPETLIEWADEHRLIAPASIKKMEK